MKMEKTKIEWTDASDNPIMTADGSFYCFKISEGCEHCYAEGMARRVSAIHGAAVNKYRVQKVFPELKLRRDMLAGWAKKGKPKKRFVSSMTDIAGEFVPIDWVMEILDAMAAAPLQTFQVLTKRTQRFADICILWCRKNGRTELPANIWPGTSVENQARADQRVPHLLRIPAAVHWVSCEPLLGNIDFTYMVLDDEKTGGDIFSSALIPHWGGRPAISWVVAGGESGPKARPAHPAWFNSLRDQCADADVSFFFKQWGEWSPETLPGLNARVIQVNQLIGQMAMNIIPVYGDVPMYRIGKKNAGHLLEGMEWHQFPLSIPNNKPYHESH